MDDYYSWFLDDIYEGLNFRHADGHDMSFWHNGNGSGDFPTYFAYCQNALVFMFKR